MLPNTTIYIFEGMQNLVEQRAPLDREQSSQRAGRSGAGSRAALQAERASAQLTSRDGRGARHAPPAHLISTRVPILGTS